MTKEEIIQNFDPSALGLANATIFGLPFSAEQSEIIIIPVPWEVTVSYGSGSSKGPEAVLEASFQVDLMHENYPELWKLGIFFDKIPNHWIKDSKKYKELAQDIIEAQENGDDISKNKSLSKDLETINLACRKLHDEVNAKTIEWIEKGKKVVLLGGDHSTPLGYYEALSKIHHNFGILQIDAHMDFRIAYEGFTYSHASIMYNALKIEAISQIVQVGIRDFCEEEVQVFKDNKERVSVFTNQSLQTNTFEGKNWKQQCEEIIAKLPKKVCISFDIDGLEAWYCPNTGTPVPGGLSYDKATYLINQLALSGKEIIGFDLVEVAPNENDDWDGNVGARLLMTMCGAMAKSQNMEVGSSINF
jgi:agmatinase